MTQIMLKDIVDTFEALTKSSEYQEESQTLLEGFDNDLPEDKPPHKRSYWSNLVMAVKSAIWITS